MEFCLSLTAVFLCCGTLRKIGTSDTKSYSVKKCAAISVSKGAHAEKQNTFIFMSYTVCNILHAMAV